MTEKLTHVYMMLMLGLVIVIIMIPAIANFQM